MTPQSEFLNLMAKTAEENCNLGCEISLKELPKEGGVYVELGEGFVTTQYYDKRTIRTLPVLFLCRNADQQTCLDQLGAICNYFQGLKEYPKGQLFRWLDTTIAKDVNKIGRDEDGTYHYSCILNSEIYF